MQKVPACTAYSLIGRDTHGLQCTTTQRASWGIPDDKEAGGQLPAEALAWERWVRARGKELWEKNMGNKGCREGAEAAL